jgi:hypothetical protein
MRAKNGQLPFSIGLHHEPVLKVTLLHQLVVQTGATGHHPLAPVYGSNRSKRGTFSTGLSHEPVLKFDCLHATPLAPVRGSNRC